MIEVVDLAKHYRAGDGSSVRAVDGISFSVAAGEMVGLLGANGAGKTTLLRTAVGLLSPTEVRVLFDGDDVTSASSNSTSTSTNSTSSSGLTGGKVCSPDGLMCISGVVNGSTTSCMPLFLPPPRFSPLMSVFLQTRCPIWANPHSDG